MRRGTAGASECSVLSPARLPLQIWCKEHARLSCECLRQCHAHYCNEEDGDPSDCISYREPHSEWPARRPGALLARAASRPPAVAIIAPCLRVEPSQLPPRLRRRLLRAPGRPGEPDLHLPRQGRARRQRGCQPSATV
jgi:hypothetical protein